jgi:hypothetical protein
LDVAGIGGANFPVRAPDFKNDGWCLDDGEEYHREAPETFWLPDLAVRMALRPGDFAKLIFRIAVEGDEPVSVERMWVIVRECVPGGYVGMLDNEPDAIKENGEFWLGTELPFEYRHIIAVESANEESVALARAPAPIPWENSN